MVYNTQNLKTYNSGFVILFAVVFSGILLTVGVGVANIALKEINFSTSARATNDSFLAADTGVECALFNDKEGSTSFVEGVNGTVSCLGGSFTVTSTAPAPIASWRFVIPSGIGTPAQNYCSIVTVTKDNNLYYTKTDIVSKGYNVGDAQCNSTNPNRVERELKVTYAEGAVFAYDDFTDNSGVNLSAHSPTGVNAGTAWVQQVLPGFPGVLSHNGSNKITDTFSNQGSRYKMNDNLGTDQMDIQADFTSTASGATDVTFGLLGRLAASTGASAIQGYYDHNYAGGPAWVISDGTNPRSSSPGNLPASPFTMKLEIRSGVSKLYVNGQEQVSRNTNKFTGQNYGGIMVGNFTGVAGKVTVDNYISVGY